MSTYTVLIITINLCIALWLFLLYFFCFSPLLRLFMFIKKAGYHTVFSFLSQKISTWMQNRKIDITISRSFNRYLVCLSIPFRTPYEISFSTKHSKTGEFFLFCGKNIFIDSQYAKTDPGFQRRRSGLYQVFMKYLPGFRYLSFHSLRLSSDQLHLIVSADSLAHITPNLPELVIFLAIWPVGLLGLRFRYSSSLQELY